MDPPQHLKVVLASLIFGVLGALDQQGQPRPGIDDLLANDSPLEPLFASLPELRGAGLANRHGQLAIFAKGLVTFVKGFL